MSRKLRLLRLIAIVFGVILFGGYFAFATFLFNPLEGGFALDVSALVPRGVDYYCSRSDLADLFDPFPRLAEAEELAAVPAWKSFRASPEFEELDQRYGIQAALDQFEQSLAQVPLGIDLEQAFGGKDLALAGYFRPGGLERAAWAVYGRANWLGKLGHALLSYPGLLGLEAQGLSVVESEGFVSLSGGALQQPLHVGRVRDIVILAGDEELLRQSLQLAAAGSTESFFNSARYHDHIRNATRSAKRDEVELFCDVRKLLESLGVAGPLPDLESENLGLALLGRVLQLPAFTEAIGVLALREGVTLRLHIELSSEHISRFQERLYRTRGATREEVLAAAQFAPIDTAYFALVKAPIAELLNELLASAEPAIRNNLDDLFRGSKRYAGVDEVVRLLDAGLEDQFSIILRENDYPPERKENPTTGELEDVGPPNDGQPVFAACLINRMRDSAKIEQFRSNLRDMDKELGLQGRTPGSRGVFQLSTQGYTTMEFWHALVRGTGVISSLFDNAFSVTSNTIPMPVQVMQTSALGSPRLPRLTDRDEFMVLLDQMLEGGSANLVFWCDPARASRTLRAQAEIWARDEAAAGIDWVRLRKREEERLLAELFSGRATSDLAPHEEELLQQEVDQALRRLREGEAEGRFPELLAKKEREILYWETLRALVATVRFDERRMEIALRALVPLPDGE